MKVRSKLIWGTRLLILVGGGLLFIAKSFGAQDVNSSFGFNWANLTIGHLSIQGTTMERDRILLNEQLLLAGDENHVSWFIVSAYPAQGLATHVLFGFDTGDNSCRYFHKVLEIGASGKLGWSSEFGNCETLPIRKSSNRNERRPNPFF